MPYRVEYASTNRAACKGPKPCGGTKIEKDEIRFGTVVEIMGNTSFQWRHFGCISAKQVKNLTSELGAASELDGYEDLREEDQAKFDRLWADGEVPEEEAMARGHDPLAYLSLPDLKARAKRDDVDVKGLGKPEMVKAIRAAIGGAAPVKIRKEPLEEWTATELKEKCEEVGLPTSGSKPALIGRLREHFGPLPDTDDEDAGADGDDGEDRKPAVGRPKRKNTVKDEPADSDDDVKPQLKGKAAAARAKPGPKPKAKGGRKAKKEETSDEEESATSSDDSPSASSSEEESAESSASDEESSAEESDVKPKKGARGASARGRNGKRPARKEAAPAKRPQRAAAGRKAKVESDDDDDEEDVKPQVKRGKALAKGKKAVKAEPSSDEEAAPVRKKKRVVKSEPEDSE